ncbi:MAG: hypothetical protein R3E31_01590 [Chloroflexota bacterium]
MRCVSFNKKMRIFYARDAHLLCKRCASFYRDAHPITTVGRGLKRGQQEPIFNCRAIRHVGQLQALHQQMVRLQVTNPGIDLRRGKTSKQRHIFIGDRYLPEGSQSSLYLSSTAANAAIKG